MERLIQVECFRKKKVIPFEVFLSSRFYRDSPKLLYHLSTLTSARLLTVILSRRNDKDLKDEGRFPKRLSLKCLSLLVGSVGGRIRTQLQPPAGENELSFVVGRFQRPVGPLATGL